MNERLLFNTASALFQLLAVVASEMKKSENFMKMTCVKFENLIEISQLYMFL